jgi:hypothetical protein
MLNDLPGNPHYPPGVRQCDIDRAADGPRDPQVHRWISGRPNSNYNPVRSERPRLNRCTATAAGEALAVRLEQDEAGAAMEPEPFDGLS